MHLSSQLAALCFNELYNNNPASTAGPAYFPSHRVLCPLPSFLSLIQSQVCVDNKWLSRSRASITGQMPAWPGLAR